MNNKRLIWLLGVIILLLILVGLLLVLQPKPSCCTPAPMISMALKLTTTAVINRNQTLEVQIHETETKAFENGLWLTSTLTPNPFPYNPTLYAQRQEELHLLAANYSTAYPMLFYLTETAIVTNYKAALTNISIEPNGTLTPTPTS